MSDNSFDGRWLWSFGAFRLDARARLLLRDGLPVPLTPKAFDVLVHLARNENRAVAREELLEAVWPGTVVTDASSPRPSSSSGGRSGRRKVRGYWRRSRGSDTG